MLHARLGDRQARPWLVAVVASLVLAFVAQPAGASRSDDLAAAQALSRSGQHAEAAAAYESLARRTFLGWDDRVLLLAAREYQLAGRLDDAERLLAKVGRNLRPDDAVLRARVEAEVALARGRPDAAAAALRSIPPPWPAPLAAELLRLQAEAEFGAGRTLGGIRAYEERARVLGTAEERQENYSLLVDALMRNPAAAQSVPADASPAERAWLELAVLLGAPDPDARVQAQRLAEWRGRHATHPGIALLPQAIEATAGGSGGVVTLPSQPAASIALLLPLSGKFAASAVAVRDGFLAAALAEPAAGRPTIQVRDTASLGAAAVYAQAVAGGAQAVAGPLTREEVAALVASQQIPVPTLALNATAGGSPPPFLFQFTLDPEQEARLVARRIATDGRTRGIALYPRSDWGSRVQAAFEAELAQAGVELSASSYYDPGAKDFSGPLRAALGRFGGAADRDPKGGLKPRDPVAEARDGPQFAFVAASGSTARALAPQLRFQMSYELPIYATSDAIDASGRPGVDLEGTTFPEMPWILYGGQGAPELWDAVQREWASTARGKWRLYAFGYDAYRILRNLDGAARGIGVDGLTGRLTIAADGRVLRDMDWAQVQGGRTAVAGALLPALPTPESAAVEP